MRLVFPLKDLLYEVVYQMVGGLRAGMGYCGAKDIEALHDAKFTRITNAGVAESHPHDVSITSEARIIVEDNFSDKEGRFLGRIHYFSDYDIIFLYLKR